jgi:hypothetical protein
MTVIAEIGRWGPWWLLAAILAASGRTSLASSRPPREVARVAARPARPFSACRCRRQGLDQISTAWRDRPQRAESERGVWT